jgi:hypothetical protein
LLNNPFNLYGGFVSLNLEEKKSIIENKIYNDLHEKAKFAEFDVSAIQNNNEFLLH